MVPSHPKHKEQPGSHMQIHPCGLLTWPLAPAKPVPNLHKGEVTPNAWPAPRGRQTLPVWPRAELSGGVSGAIVSGSLSLPHNCPKRWGKVYSQLQSAKKTSRARCPQTV